MQILSSGLLLIQDTINAMMGDDFFRPMLCAVAVASAVGVFLMLKRGIK